MKVPLAEFVGVDEADAVYEASKVEVSNSSFPA